jgi:hypothetical protein
MSSRKGVSCGGQQPTVAADGAAGSGQHELKAASVLQSQSELARSGQHDRFTDAGNVDVPGSLKIHERGISL